MKIELKGFNDIDTEAVFIAVFFGCLASVVIVGFICDTILKLHGKAL